MSSRRTGQSSVSGAAGILSTQDQALPCAATTGSVSSVFSIPGDVTVTVTLPG